jgi:predicted outer membrane protein
MCHRGGKGFVRLRRGRRTGEILVLVVALVATTVALFVILQRPSTNPLGSASTLGHSPWGPVEDIDRTLLVKVHQASLWEGPTGLQVQQRGSNARVKQVGLILHSDHVELDREDREIAAKLGVGLPSKPNADQQSWLAELAGESGPTYDRTFVLRLRFAHGQVLAAIAVVRASTANSLIRQFADHCHDVVLKHMTLLESTGLVDYRQTR